jgi:hypothetical protein
MAEAFRLHCCIAGCARTFKAQLGDRPDDWVMCSKHWRMAPLSWRRRVTRLRRIIGRGKEPKAERARALHVRQWHRCRRYIEDRLAGRVDDADLAQFLETI